MNVAFRAYTSGGSRSVVDKVDDGKLMQEMGGNFMKGETRGKVESPQNYGYTSVVMPADKDKQGNLEMGAETFISFMGGSRSFPVATVMDDRRHRLKELKPGDVAMFGAREWGQQFHLNESGMWMSGNTEKKIRLQLVQNSNKDDQRGGGSTGGSAPGVQAQAAGGGGGGESGGQQQQQQQKAKGQKQLYDKDSSDFIEITADKITIRRGNGYVVIKDDVVIGYVEDQKKSFRADKEHTHIRHKDQAIWVDEKGCWSTTPIKQKDHNDQQT